LFSIFDKNKNKITRSYLSKHDCSKRAIFKKKFFFPLFQVAQQWSVLKEKRACNLSFDLKLLAVAEKHASREKQTYRQTERYD
jgi:hypothetical protein